MKKEGGKQFLIFDNADIFTVEGMINKAKWDSSTLWMLYFSFIFTHFIIYFMFPTKNIFPFSGNIYLCI